ncbi:MAG: ATP-binding cassette domain-containing protein [Pseudomonadota bacterium]|nr:ATP-binding cassette domain-containing protein [Pseudomonadota bacterium]
MTADQQTAKTPTIQIRGLGKFFGNIIALKDVSFEVYKGEVTALLGDNGAGKSTLIKTLSGVYRADEGEIAIDGKPVSFSSPRGAAAAGIGTVYQDLALQPLMSVSRNFFLGRELSNVMGFLDFKQMDAITREEMAKIGIDVADPSQPIGTMSGGQRQTLAIARAIYFGAKILILDEPTSALGQKQQLEVLRTIKRVRDRGDLAIVFITHNDLHAKLIGDRFAFLNRGKVIASGGRDDIDMDNIRALMAGGAELADLSREFAQG